MEPARRIESPSRHASWARLSRSLRSTAIGLGLAVAAGPATAGLSGYQGAWVLAGRDCAEVYASAGRSLSFRKPIDLFAPAFIVSGQRLKTPMASCRIKAVRTVQGRDHLDLDCANAVAVNDVKVIMAATPDGNLTRYYSDEDPTGIAYRRCSAQASRTSAK
ncbi:hypothetical protein HBB12_031845 (plasmid) [Methylobacterium sp. SyP6R]|nr:hypothetical protein [Methylobacterium sp. SyP6R]MCF4129887.1 hypothetical protein [Methylobacterium sp. SyP6R]